MGRRKTGAGEGNRTLVVSLENFCSTIELHPQCPQPTKAPPTQRPLQAIATTPANQTAHKQTQTMPGTLVEGEGFEPSKAEPSDLQSDPFDRSGTPPNRTRDYANHHLRCQIKLALMSGCQGKYAWDQRILPWGRRRFIAPLTPVILQQTISDNHWARTSCRKQVALIWPVK